METLELRKEKSVQIFSIWSKKNNSLTSFDTREEVEQYVKENPDDIMLSNGGQVFIMTGIKKIVSDICISDMQMSEIISMHRAIISAKKHHKVVFVECPSSREDVLKLTSIAKEWRKEVLCKLHGEFPIFDIETKNLILTTALVVIVKNKKPLYL